MTRTVRSGWRPSGRGLLAVGLVGLAVFVHRQSF
jgi:hypothetical protein